MKKDSASKVATHRAENAIPDGQLKCSHGLAISDQVNVSANKLVDVLLDLSTSDRLSKPVAGAVVLGDVDGVVPEAGAASPAARAGAAPGPGMAAAEAALAYDIILNSCNV